VLIEIGPRPTDKLAALTLYVASFYFNFVPHKVCLHLVQNIFSFEHTKPLDLCKNPNFPFKPMHFIQPVQFWHENISLVTSHENLLLVLLSFREHVILKIIKSFKL